MSENWDKTTDLLIVGSGAAGLSTGIFGRKAGLDVIICEKTAVVGGTTATSGGIAWIPNSRQAKVAGIEDSIEKVRTYLKYELGSYYREDLVEAFLEAAPQAINELQDDTDVVFDLTKFADYHAGNPGGARFGRALEPRRYDGRRLGKDFELVRPPLERLLLLGGLMIDKRKLDMFLNPLSSRTASFTVIRTLIRYAFDRLKYSRGTEICAGNALVARMLYTLRELEARICTESPLVELIRDGERVIGAVVDRDGAHIRVKANHGVILATGGFPHSAEMRRTLGPNHPHDHSVGYYANVGDGIRAGISAGGAVDRELVGPGWWQPSSLLKHPNGTEETILYGYLDRGRPGVIAVDKTAKRFVNESNSYHDIGEAMFRAGVDGNRFYFICDRSFVWKRGLGLIRPFAVNLKRYERMGYISLADNLRDLARKIDLDEVQLEETVRRHNDFCRTGVDLDFGKGEDPYNRMFGDPSVGPNPNLAPIVKPPFVALRIYPSTIATCLGLKVDASSQVLDEDNRPVDGLYACGNDMSTVMRGFYPGGGATIGPAITFAYIAVRSIVATRQNTAETAWQ